MLQATGHRLAPIADRAPLVVANEEHRLVAAEQMQQVGATPQAILLAGNQSTCIPPGVNHRLKNPGRLPLELIEVQSGSYPGEDDIVRLEDTYGGPEPAQGIAGPPGQPRQRRASRDRNIRTAPGIALVDSNGSAKCLNCLSRCLNCTHAAARN